jgi:CRP-like cAMP-binding protein
VDTMTAVERILLLRQVPLFGSLAEERLAIFADEARERRVAAGEELLREGMPVSAIHVIVQGEVVLLRRGAALHVAERASSVGVFDWLTGRAMVTARAARSTTTLEIGAEALRTILEDNFDVVVHLFEAVGRVVIERRLALDADAGYPEPRSTLSSAISAPLGLVQRTLLLRSTLPFGRGSVEALADLARQAREVKHGEGASLWQTGARADHLLVLVQGSVECSAPGGQVFRFGPGDTVGFVDCLGATPRWYAAVATAPTLGLRVDLEDLFDVLEDDFELTLECLGAFATQAVRLLDEGLRAVEEQGPRSLPMPRVRDVQPSSRRADSRAAIGGDAGTAARRRER